MPLRLIMFDLDGTLVDSHAFITATLAETFVAEGLTPPSPAEARHIIGLSLHEALKTLSGEEGAVVEALVGRYRTLYRQKAEAGTAEEGLFPGAREVVELLHAAPDTLLGVATGKSMRGVNRLLATHDLDAHFLTRQTPDTNPSKPHPGMLQVAMVEMGVEPHETLMIGDTTFDMEMARAAGCHALGVSWGAHDLGSLTEAGAHLIIDDISTLPGAVDQLYGLTHA